MPESFDEAQIVLGPRRLVEVDHAQPRPLLQPAEVRVVRPRSAEDKHAVGQRRRQEPAQASSLTRRDGRLVEAVDDEDEALPELGHLRRRLHE